MNLCLLFTALVVCGVTTVTGQPSAGLSIARPRCGPVCMIYCEYGNVLDWRGCPTCQCRGGPGTSPMPRCPRGTVSTGRTCRRFGGRCGFNAFCHTSIWGRRGRGRGVCCRRRRPIGPPGGGRCPLRPRRFSICAIRQDSCWSDADCRRFERCCPSGCGRRCQRVSWPSLYV